MTQKEKAKAYDEAIKKAAVLYKASEPMSGCNVILETLFPELKESEDERIRKELLEHCKNQAEAYIQTGNKCPQIQSWIAWLEKQGTPAKLSEEEQNKFAKVVLRSCAMSFIDYLDAHKYEGKMCVSNGECEDIENAFHNAMWDRLHRYYCKYIEKQGEQKASYTTIAETGNGGINALVTLPIEMKTAEESLGVDSKTYNKIVDECIFDEQNDSCVKDYNNIDPHFGKSIDKTESKFHEGEWVVTDKNNIVQIKAIENGKYLLENTMRFSVDYVDKCWRKWDISDAKDGDVLICKGNYDDGILEKIGYQKDTESKPNGRVVYTLSIWSDFYLDINIINKG